MAAGPGLQNLKNDPKRPKTAFLGYQIGLQTNRYVRKQLLNE
jgi:hypothetical protein